MCIGLSKKNIRIILVCLLVFIVCAVVQYASFHNQMQSAQGRSFRYSWIVDSDFNAEAAEQIIDTVKKEYGEAVVEVVGPRAASATTLRVRIKIDHWVNGSNPEYRPPPELNELLSETIQAPLLIITAVLLPVLAIIPIERDYRPNKSILTLLRLPRDRSRYLMSKLVYPSVLIFIFWGSQFLVASLQSNHYFNTVPHGSIKAGTSAWAFDYYRMLYPVLKPIWFPAVICALVMIPLVLATMTFIAKGGMKSWQYAILPCLGVAAIVLVFNRIFLFWLIMPVLLAATFYNSITLMKKGQIVQ